MKRNLFSSLFFVLLIINISVSAAEVPYTIEFAGMQLRISEQGRKRIKADMDQLQQNDKYFQVKLERVNMYFPLIEKVLEEEDLPGDFKYLAVQESSLISDAVSSSNAVGYWQFKKESALEVGLVIDSEVDERKHIISATKGAARYLKRNNYFLKNWVYTLLSYNVGLGGCKSMISQQDIGAVKMEIDVRTHWYIIKFLAHKLAFQDVVGKNAQPSLMLLSYADAQGKSLSEIARHMELPLESVEMYNKWLNRKRVPEDRDYIVIIPAPRHQAEVLLARINTPLSVPVEKPDYAEPVFASTNLNAPFPVLEKKKSRGKKHTKAVFYTINDRPGIQAQAGDNIARLAATAGISPEKFIKYNDLKANESLRPGEVYYLRKKRNKASVEEHIVTEGETMWQISQKYGITLPALLRKNRMKRPEKLKHGRVIWLRSVRPAKEPVEIRSVPKPATAMAVNKSALPAAKPAEEKKSQAKTVEEKKLPVKVAEEKKQPVRVAEEKKIVARPAREKPVMENDKEPIATTSVPKPDTEDVEPEKTQAVETKAEQENEQPSLKTAEAEVITEAEPRKPEPAEPNSTLSKTHTVATGQTLYAISKLYNVSITQLREWNNLQASDGLKIGQILVIEEGKNSNESQATIEEQTGTDEFIEYTVQRGDTLYKIAKDHAVTVKELASWNNKETYSVSIGEKLKIKPGK